MKQAIKQKLLSLSSRDDLPVRVFSFVMPQFSPDDPQIDITEGGYRWRKLPADFANPTQFFSKLKHRKSRRIPKAEGGPD